MHFGKLSTFGRCFCFMANLDNAAGCAVSGQDYFYPQDEQNRGIQDDEFPFTKVTKLMSVRKSVSCCVRRDLLGLSIACVEC